MTASAAARRMSSGPGSSGKPWPRLMALLSRASCDIASKMVTGRSAKTLFMEVMERSAAGLGRQSRGLPGQHSPREVLVVGQTAGLSGQRRRDRSFPGAAGKDHLLALGIRNVQGIETRKRNDDGTRIGFRGNLVRLADVDEKIAAIRHSLRYIFRRQILDLMTRHANPPNDLLLPNARFQGQTSPLARRKSSARNKFKTTLEIRESPASPPRPPARSESENSRPR